MALKLKRFKDLNDRQKRDAVRLYNKKWINYGLLERAQKRHNTPSDKANEERSIFSKLSVDILKLEQYSSNFSDGQLIALEGKDVAGLLTTARSKLFDENDVPKYYSLFTSKSFASHFYRNNGRKVLYCISIVGEGDAGPFLLDAVYDEFGKDYLIMPYSAPRSLRIFFAEEPPQDMIEKYVFEIIEKEGKRRLKDGVINFHVSRGAKIVIREDGRPLLIRNSRPEDVMSFGYNILLTYSELVGVKNLYALDPLAEDVKVKEA